MRSLVETAVMNQAAYVAIAHNHPSGALAPSFLDKGLTGEVFKSLRRVNIGFIDHFLVTSSEALPLTRRQELVKYTDFDDSFYK